MGNFSLVECQIPICLTLFTRVAFFALRVAVPMQPSCNHTKPYHYYQLLPNRESPARAMSHSWWHSPRGSSQKNECIRQRMHFFCKMGMPSKQIRKSAYLACSFGKKQHSACCRITVCCACSDSPCRFVANEAALTGSF